MTRQQLTKPNFGSLTTADATAIGDHDLVALIDAASYRHGVRQAALRRQYEDAAQAVRGEFISELVKLHDGEGGSA